MLPPISPKVLGFVSLINSLTSNKNHKPHTPNPNQDFKVQRRRAVLENKGVGVEEDLKTRRGSRGAQRHDCHPHGD